MKTPSHIAQEIMAQIDLYAEQQAKDDQFHNSVEFHKSHILGALEDLTLREEATT